MRNFSHPTCFPRQMQFALLNVYATKCRKELDKQCLFYQNEIQVNSSSGEGDRPILDMQCADAIK